MPHNYKRMTTTLKASCRYSNCVDAEYLHEDLMSWRDQNLKDLERSTSIGKEWLECNAELKDTMTYQEKEREVHDLNQELIGFRNDVF